MEEGGVISQDQQSKDLWSVFLKGVPLSLSLVPWLVPSAMPPTYHVLWVDELKAVLASSPPWMPGLVQAFEQR